MNGGVNQSSPIYSYVMPLAGGYDSNGNLLTANDSVMGQWTYSYDSLNRLTGAQAPVSQPAGVSAYFAGIASGWTYDAFGNRRTEAQGAISGASPQAAMPASSSATYNTSNQLTAASQNAGGGLTYDASGNVIYDGTNTYLYDAESRLCAVKNAAGGLTGYVYDAAGIRVAKGGLTSFTCNFAASGGNGFAVNTSWTLGPGGEQIGEFAVSGTTSTWTHSNVFAAGKLLATYNSTGTYYDMTDWLGTKRVEANAALTCETGFRSLPYGNGLTSYAPTALPQCVDATEQHYTGKERDVESGNDYFEARYYASGFGRFMSPDWSAKEEPVPYAKLDDPQSLNLYAYVRDNPVTGFDPDGHQCKAGDKDCQARLQQMVKAQDSAMNKPEFKATTTIDHGRSTETTHCAEGLGAITRDTGGPVDVIHGNATQIIDNVSKSDKYHVATPEEAQRAADSGIPAFGGWRNPNPHGHSHVVSVRAEGVPGDRVRPGTGPLLANIGPARFSGVVHQSGAFSKDKQVTYWVMNTEGSGGKP